MAATVRNTHTHTQHCGEAGVRAYTQQGNTWRHIHLCDGWPECNVFLFNLIWCQSLNTAYEMPDRKGRGRIVQRNIRCKMIRLVKKNITVRK